MNQFSRVAVVSLVLAVWSGPATANAQTVPPAQTPAAATPPPVLAASDYIFAPGSGLLVFYVKPAKVADFEAILARLAEALAKAQGPARKLQAAHWEIFKSTETSPDAQVFLFLFNPVAKDANYDPLLLLAEALPAEAQPLYARLKEAIIKVERMGLTKIR